jgi:hypothetical protein
VKGTKIKANRQNALKVRNLERIVRQGFAKPVTGFYRLPVLKPVFFLPVLKIEICFISMTNTDVSSQVISLLKSLLNCI